MTRRRWHYGAAAAAGVVALAVVAAGCGGGGEASLPHDAAAMAQVSLTPPAHLFAEPVVAGVDVVVDPHKVDPSKIRVQTAFAPYEIVRATRTREDAGGLTRFQYRFTIRCLLIQCIPKILPSAAGEAESGRGDRMSFTFGRVRVLAPAAKDGAKGAAKGGAKSGERVIASAAWPPLESVSRINAASIPDFGYVFKTSVLPLASLTYRISPALLAALLLAAAAALLVLPAVLVRRWWVARRPEPVEEEPELPPLERALRLVEWTAGRDDPPARREALEVLAAELDSSVDEAGRHAPAARVLAWSPAPPSGAAAEELADEVRRSNGAHDAHAGGSDATPA